MFEDDNNEFPLEPLSNDKQHELKKRSEMLEIKKRKRKKKKRTTCTFITDEKIQNNYIIN